MKSGSSIPSGRSPLRRALQHLLVYCFTVQPELSARQCFEVQAWGRSINIYSYFCLIAITLVSITSCNSGSSSDAGADIDSCSEFIDCDDNDSIFDGDTGDIDAPPQVEIIRPRENMTYTDGNITVLAVVGDDRVVLLAEVHLTGEVESWTEQMDLQQIIDSPEYKEYSASYTTVFSEHCFVDVENYEISVVVKDSSDQTATESVVATYCHACMPCEVMIEFSEGTTEETITNVGAGIGAYIRRKAPAHSERTYIIGFPVDVDRVDVIDTFRSAGIVDWVDDLCGVCFIPP